MVGRVVAVVGQAKFSYYDVFQPDFHCKCRVDGESLPTSVSWCFCHSWPVRDEAREEGGSRAQGKGDGRLDEYGTRGQQIVPASCSEWAEETNDQERTCAMASRTLPQSSSCRSSENIIIYRWTNWHCSDMLRSDVTRWEFNIGTFSYLDVFKRSFVN